MWTVVAALYCGLVVAANPEDLEWLVICCFPALILGLRVWFGPWIACHVSAIGAGAVLVASVFEPAPPGSVFEVQNAFIVGCGSGYLAFVLVELVRWLIDWIDDRLQSKPKTDARETEAPEPMP